MKRKDEYMESAEKIEKGITYGWNIEQKSTGIHLRIQRKEYKEGEK